MRKTTLGALTGITIALVAAAVVVHSRDAAFAPSAGEKLFPTLGDKLNDVGAIAITREGESFTLKRTGKDWVFEEKGEYPASFETVKQTLLALADLGTVEPKTRRPSLYPRIQVEDPGQPEAHSTGLTVKDGSGQALADLIVGKRRFSRTGVGPAMVYVRKADEAQSWLAAGELKLDPDFLGWIERDIVDLPPERVREVRIRHEDGSELRLSRDAADQDFALVEDSPEGAKIESQSKLDAIAGALDGLKLSDVAPVERVAFEANAAGSATFRTFEGLLVSARLATVEGETWVSFRAEIDEGKVQGGPEVREEAKELNARLGEWVYRIPDNNLKKLQTTLADLTEPEDAS